MDFFDSPPSHDMQQMPVFRQPPWLGPQENVLPKLVDLQLVAARTDDACVVFRNFLAFFEGWSFDVVTLTKVPDMTGAAFGMFGPPPGFPGAPPPDEMFRYGFLFSDGSKVTSTSFMAPPDQAFDPFGKPDHPVMTPGGGGSAGGRTAVHSHWCWPLPPAGDVSVIVEWNAQGIDSRELTFDASLIRDAASQAEELWSDDHLPEPPDQWGQGVQVRVN